MVMCKGISPPLTTFDGKVKYHAPEATYLAWLDLSLTKAGAAPEATEYILEHAKVRLATGSDYSQRTVIDTHSWVRLNFATNEETLREILKRVGSVL
jgi:cystathionine beta-lyase